MREVYADLLNKDRPNTLLYIVGSYGFGVHTTHSDLDLFHVALDINERLGINKPTPVVTGKTDFTLEGAIPKVEIDYMELGMFMESVSTGASLKAIEAASKYPEEMNLFEEGGNFADLNKRLLNFLLTPRIVYIDLYIKEINRRFRKLFYKKINPDGKNYNSTVGFDTKEAAHLYRVIHGAFSFFNNGRIKTDYSDYRGDMWSIRKGDSSYDSLYEYFNNLKNQVEDLQDLARRERYFPEVEDAQSLYHEIVYRTLQVRYSYDNLY